ncbi:hypothetical protein RHSIM_Rhsim02G0168300 [Rhododendron simsii]|uniref:tRNA-binding domain-containing protein n=1 Tax=Rhododendron simsii TaxID=118357 RepID=A0A834HE90_RHOSS|nr:hypothetical protein RHSIM_Rhsim02G0168300 [Rhododendron simsii]
MVVVNLLKCSTALLRTYGGGGGTSFRCQIKPNRNWDFLKWKNRPLAQSPLRISLRSCKCTSAPIDSSSSSVIQETASSPAGAGDDVVDMSVMKDSANTLDMRVGVIVKAWRHEEADSLYVEEVDIGEPQPRIICSGLVNFVPLDHLQDRKVVVLANLKPRNMRGVKSSGMLMAASDASHENVELLVPPEGSTPGERIWFGSAEEKENLPDAASPNQVCGYEKWEETQGSLRERETGMAVENRDSQMQLVKGPFSLRFTRNALL